MWKVAFSDSNIMKENYFKNAIAEMWIEDGILYVKHNNDVVVTKEAAVTMVRERLRICENTSYPMFFDSRGMKYATKEAREYTKQSDGVKYIKAAAFIVNNTALKIFINYYYKVNPLPVPVKLFTDGQKAIQWLQQFKIQS